MNRFGRSVSYKEELLESLQDPEEMAAYINAALEDEDPHVFLLALRDAAEARGGIGWLAEASDLNRESLYRTLSTRGNPRFSSLRAVLSACGLDLAVHPVPQKRSRRRQRPKY